MLFSRLLNKLLRPHLMMMLMLVTVGVGVIKLRAKLMVPFLQKPSMLSMQCLRTCTSSVLVQMQAWLVILCLLLTGPLTLCKKESQVKLKKMAFSHEKSRKSHKKNRLFLDFSWLKTIFFDLTWLSFLQRFRHEGERIWGLLISTRVQQYNKGSQVWGYKLPSMPDLYT